MNKEISFKQIMESHDYEKQKSVIFNEINKIQAVVRTKAGVYAPTSSIPSVDRTMVVNYTEFKKTDKEKAELATLKAKLPKTRGHKFQRVTLITT